MNSQCCKHQTPVKEEKIDKENIDNLPAVVEVKAEKVSTQEMCVKKEETPQQQSTCEAKDTG